MAITFVPIPDDAVRKLRAGGLDAYGMAPERACSDGGATPCRHCLRHIPAGSVYLILAHRPFAALQPYAETGPIFLCADHCMAGGGADLPPMLTSRHYILRGYDTRERIIYGTGAVVETAAIPARAAALLARPEVAFLHLRSAANNCYQLRIERAAG